MRQKPFALFVAFVVAACGGGHGASPTAPDGARANFRAVTWNVQQSSGATVDEQAAFLASLNADVVVLQEVYKGELDRFRSALGERTRTSWTARYAPALRLLDGNDGAGVAAFTTLPVVASGQTLMRHADRWTSARSALHLRVAHPQHPGGLDIFTTHLAAGAEASAAREKQVDELVRWAKSYSAPAILGGDLNATPGEAVISNAATPAGQALGADFIDVWRTLGRSGGETWSSASPSRRIDYWLVKRGPDSAITPLEAAVIDACARRSTCLSDHHALLASFHVAAER